MQDVVWEDGWVCQLCKTHFYELSDELFRPPWLVQKPVPNMEKLYAPAQYKRFGIWETDELELPKRKESSLWRQLQAARQDAEMLP